ncbi:glycosyltransferase [Pedobacter frigoris]|uniref:glycosyltransferase n=1 Tax=Pedobacter frigoris TaxID=2571272 RepID=UPI0029307032|nr:glycosyltransferase [Pedobacter frigoris]
MKVLHITTYITGGAGIAVKRLHEALLDEGVDSKILCLFALPENISREIYQLNQSRSFTYRILKKLKLDKNSRLIKNLRGNFEAFSSPHSPYNVHLHPLVIDADIIHLHWISDFVDIPTFFKSVKKPIIWTAHDLNPILGGFHYEQDVIKNPCFSLIEEKFKKLKHHYIKKANVHFIGSSTITVQKIEENLPGVSCSKIPCILDLRNFQPIDKKKAKTALGISENTLILGSGADDLTNYRKGYWLLLEALEMMDENDKDRFKILSFGAKKGTFQHNTPKSPDTIKFEPIYDKRLHSLIYSAMDYFVIPSVEETFGLTGTEALLCNTPVISSKTGGMVDYVEDGVNGFLFEPLDKAALLMKIKNIVHSIQNVDDLNCRQSIIDWYEREQPVAKHIQLYNEKLKN